MTCASRPPTKGKYCDECRLINKAAGKRHREKVKFIVFDTYGGECACCGSTNPRTFQLDHVNNDGTKHRKEIQIPTVRWAYNNSCPDTLQILCANCHHIKTVYGGCTEEDHSQKR